MNLAYNLRRLTRLRGVTGMPDFLLRKTRWGYKWSRIGDKHDDLFRRGCPFAWANDAYVRMCRALGLMVVGPAARPFFWAFKWKCYKPEIHEIWTRQKLRLEILEFEKIIRQEVAKRWPR